MATPNMNLNLPVVSTTPGPAWASNINSAFDLVDSHNHTSGFGVAIPSSGLNINADLPFNANNATILRSVRFNIQNAPLGAGNDLACLYSVNGDLYYNSGAGAQIQLTIGGALNATSIGGIGGDYQTSSAAVFYTSLTDTFTFWQSSGVNAAIDVGQIKIRYPGTGAYYVGLNASVGVAADFNMTLPLALPASQKFMTLDAAGQIAAPWEVDGSTLEVASGTTVQVRNLGITLGKLATAVANALVPVGTIIPFAGTTPPSDYLFCDGSAVSRSVYASLFTTISTRYGAGDGVNTFNIPDLRWNFMRGYGPTLTATGSGTAASNQATFTAHGLHRTGIQVRRVSGTLSGFNAGQTYFAIVIDANTLAFATTYAFAMAGTRTTITGANSLVISQYEDPDIATRLQVAQGGALTGIGTRQAYMIQSHAHTQQLTPAGSQYFGPYMQTYGNFTTGLISGPDTLAAGGNETRPINVYVNYLIKV